MSITTLPMAKKESKCKSRILALKDLGFPLEQIAQLLEEDLSLEQLQGMFKLKQAQTQQMINTVQTRLTRIAARLRQIEQEGKMPAYEVLLKQVDALLVACVREIVPLHGSLERSFGKISAYLNQQRAQPCLACIQFRNRQQPAAAESGQG